MLTVHLLNTEKMATATRSRPSDSYGEEQQVCEIPAVSKRPRLSLSTTHFRQVTLDFDSEKALNLAQMRAQTQAVDAKMSSSSCIVDMLNDHVLVNILQRLTDHLDRLAWSLCCKHFYRLEAACRSSISLLRADSIPVMLRRYSLLQHIDLSTCVSLSDPSLLVISQAVGKTLLSVKLAKNFTFTDVGLEYLAQGCQSLVDLDLSNCVQVTDLGILALTNIPTLQSLKLIGCRCVTDFGIVNLVSKCGNLQCLNLKGCLGITDNALAAIGTYSTRLWDLDVSHTEITSRGLLSVSKLKHLVSLNITACIRVNDAGLLYLQNGCKSLQTLNLSWCKGISHGAIMNLAGSDIPLQHIILSHCKSVPNAMLQSFVKFDRLQSIRFDGCDLNNSELSLLGKYCTNLRSVSFSKCTGVTDSGISAIVEACSRLESIDLTCCSQITGTTLSFIARYCKRLTSLKMESCSFICQSGLYELGSSCQSLEELDLTEIGIDDEGLKAIAKCKSLRMLKLGFCSNVHDKGLSYIASGCSNLRELDIYRSDEISDVGIAAIACGCTKLVSLNMSYCTRIGDAGLASISQLQDLKILEMRGCTGISSLGLIAVAKNCRRLVELDLKRCSSLEAFVPLALAQYCKSLRQINISYCNGTDEGVVALAKLYTMQNMRLIHVRNVTIQGFHDLLLLGKSLKKVKLLLELKQTLPKHLLMHVTKQGCSLRWMEKAP